MFSESAQYYDLIYSQFKDYAAESKQIAELIRAEQPKARRILDVACGTGEHARLLEQEHGFQVDGLDVDATFVRIAQEKLARGTVYQGDMADFSLPGRYDVVLCLFSSIGYLRTADRVAEAFKRFAEQIKPDGVILVEPWFEPGAWSSGRFFVHTGVSPEVAVCRMSHSTVEGAISRLHFEYLIGTVAGIERKTEIHELGLLTKEEILECFAVAGLSATHDPKGLIGRGLYTARYPGGRTAK